MASLIGKNVGRYQILEQLGTGGMATVYKAFDTSLERNVAIKVIRTDQFAPAMLEELRKRFEREAKTLAKLSHPNIVHVHDYGEFEGAPYLVMEYLPSGTLQNRYSKPMPWQQAVYLLLPIAQALAYAHEQHVIHRDIKPGNILLTEKGLPMLSDFGIAKILGGSDAATLTGAGMTIGTPEYMAPEQWTGQSSQQSDIYSLAVVLYELVTGCKPFTADTPAGVMLKQVNEPLPSPRKIIPGLPEGLEAVLIKALDKEPAHRYPGMEEFSAVLESLSGGRTLMTADREENPARGTILAASSRQIPTAEAIQQAGKIDSKESHAVRWKLWIPLGALTVILFIGLAAGTSLVLRGIKGEGPLAGLGPFKAAASTQPGPTQLVPLTGGDSPTAIPADTQPPASGSTVQVLWDVSHGPRTDGTGTAYTPDGLYNSLKQYLGTQNFMVTSGDLSHLSSYDILVISELSGQQPYTSDEVNAIDQFVRVSGHGLLILSGSPQYENLAAAVSTRFAINLGELNSNGPTSLVNEQPYFQGIRTIQFPEPGGTLQVSTPSQTAAVDQNGSSVVASCECDNGRVLVIADSGLWTDQGLNLADNQPFAINVFKWLAGLTP